MILFTILTLIAILLITFMIAVISAGGAIFAIIFADVIVCIGIIVFIIKRRMKK